MGLIYPQAVKMRPSGSNASRYKSLGYKLPMKNKSSRYSHKMVIDTSCYFDVIFDDLPEYSNAILWYNCDCCGELNYIICNDYYRRHTNPYRPLYCRKCSITVMNRGPLNKRWNSSLTQEERLIQRRYPEYINFVKRVLARDDYTCQCCGKKSKGDMEVHHLNGYNWDIEHRTDDTNGITLCESCHYNFHALYGKQHNTIKQFEEWIGHRVIMTEFIGEVYSLPYVYCIEDDIIYINRFDAAEKIGCHPNTIWTLCTEKCNTYHGKHYIYYDNYLKMSEEELNNYLLKGSKKYRKDKRVICKNTGQIYDKPYVAAKQINYKHVENINNCCNGVQKSAGKYNGYSLQWMWYTDFQQLSPQEQL